MSLGMATACMFSAVLRQVSGEHSHYTAESLRQAVVDHLRENPYRDAERTTHYRDFLSDTVRTDGMPTLRHPTKKT